MKGMLKLISFILLMITFSLKAEIISIHSLNTTEGAELDCVDDHVKLFLYGETYQGSIQLNKKSGFFQVESNMEYYNVPSYADDVESKPVFMVKKTYFIKDNKVISAISLDPFYRKDSDEELSLISTAINEAHINNKCLSWSFL